MKRLGPVMAIALAYIESNPGCCAADVDRACRTARGGHHAMYRVVDRLLSGGWVLRGEDRQRRPNAAGLYAANVSTKDPVTLAGAYQRVDGAVAWMQLDNGRAEVEGLWPSWAAYGRAKELIA